MKKTFMTLGLASLMMLGACGSKNANENNCDTDTIIEQSVTVITETPASVTSAAELSQIMEQNGWKIDDKGNIVDSTGVVVMTFGDAAQAYGAYYKEAMENSGKSFSEAVKAAGSEVGAAAEAAVLQAKEKTSDAVETAKEKTSEAVQTAKEKAAQGVQDAKDATSKAVGNAKEKAGKAAQDAGNAVNNLLNK